MVKLSDDISIMPMFGGAYVARATCGQLTADVPLPRGFEKWPADEIEAHFRRFVGPELRTKMERLKAEESQATDVIEAEIVPEVPTV